MPVTNSIPDLDRYASYEPEEETTNFPVGFVLFTGDAEEAKSQIEVKIDGLVLDEADYTLSGTFDLTTDYPVVTDAEVVLPDGVTGVFLEIEGKKTVERVAQLPSGQGVAPHYWNVILNRIWAILRELSQRLNRVPMMPYGEAPPTAAEMMAWRDYVVDPGAVISVNGDSGVVTIDKDGVGLGNVANYPVASQAEAEAGVAPDKYLTPQRGAQLVSALAPAATYAPGFMFGLTLENSAIDTTNDLVINAGACRDGADTADMVLAVALTKRLDAAWVVGTDQGGIDVHPKTISTWYHVWLIKRTDGAVVDALFSLHATAPTMPTGYTYKRRLGAVRTSAAGAILAFHQFGDEFRWDALVEDVNSSNAGTAAILHVLTIPTGLRLEAVLNVGPFVATEVNVYWMISSPYDTNEVPTISNANASSNSGPSHCQMRVRADTAGRVRSRVSASSTNYILNIATRGWIDTRGRLSSIA